MAIDEKANHQLRQRGQREHQEGVPADAGRAAGKFTQAFGEYFRQGEGRTLKN